MCFARLKKREKCTVGWWLISQTNRALISIINQKPVTTPYYQKYNGIQSLQNWVHILRDLFLNAKLQIDLSNARATINWMQIECKCGTTFGPDIVWYDDMFLRAFGYARSRSRLSRCLRRMECLSSFGSYISVVGIRRFFLAVAITSSSGKNKRCAESPSGCWT
jgi:hypothetical protein